MNSELKKNFDTLQVTDELLANIQPAPFQRPLNKNVIASMVRLVKNGEDMPSVLLARVGNYYITRDGQHRIEAFKIYPYFLEAQVRSMDEEEANKSFIAHNSVGKKVPLRHKLRVDSGESAKKLRGLALKYNCAHGQVFWLICGLNRHQGIYVVEPEARTWGLAELILKNWTNDSRMNKAGRYAHIGTFLLLGDLISNYDGSRRSLILKMKNLNYSSGSFLGKIITTSHANQKIAKGYITKKIFFRNTGA